MAGISGRAFLSVGALIVSTIAANATRMPLLGDVEKDNLARTILVYAFTHHDNYLYSNADDFYFYVDAFGRNPSPTFIKSLGSSAKKIAPWSSGRAAQSNSNWNRIGSGHNVMWVKIGFGGFSGPTNVSVFVDAECGPLCGGQSTVTLKKYAGVWHVASFTTDSME